MLADTTPQTPDYRAWGSQGVNDVYENEELQQDVLSYREFQRQRLLRDWHERRRLYECGSSAKPEVLSFSVWRHALADWALELASRSSGRSVFRRPA